MPKLNHGAAARRIQAGGAHICIKSYKAGTIGIAPRYLTEKARAQDAPVALEQALQHKASWQLCVGLSAAGAPRRAVGVDGEDGDEQ